MTKAPNKDDAASRRKRLAEELRANLKRRKAKARAVHDGAQKTGSATEKAQEG